MRDLQGDLREIGSDRGAKVSFWCCLVVEGCNALSDHLDFCNLKCLSWHFDFRRVFVLYM